MTSKARKNEPVSSPCNTGAVWRLSASDLSRARRSTHGPIVQKRRRLKLMPYVERGAVGLPMLWPTSPQGRASRVSMVSDGLFHDVSPFSTPCAHLADRLDVRLGSLPNATPTSTSIRSAVRQRRSATVWPAPWGIQQPTRVHRFEWKSSARRKCGLPSIRAAQEALKCLKR